ncbi:peptidoglycan-binding domain-containing protein [Robertmurraya andreesenii]|uniref:Peptidoglycan binding-like domain-containing protein n=1 Tax=Anoxybacillus andreesenii TaxID=1325932 RepID=A0ABT9UYQ1_9BACL|nr:peptidoglycan-binding protein [Robertmurraya andreesenii]MDQ0153807.1 hypothetical protein [Robertmurraya andreesenii]
MKKHLILLLTLALLLSTTITSVSASTLPEDIEVQVINLDGENAYQISPEDASKFEEYLKSGDADQIVGLAARGFWAKTAERVWGKIIDIVITTGLDAAIREIFTGTGKVDQDNVDTVNVKVLYYSFNAKDTRTHVCDSCINASDYVQLLQRALNSIDFNAGTVDGKWGPKTKSAVISFQRAAGITQDGYVGFNTWTKLGTRE